nr:PREDICTED: coiled-coil domain-containing protein 73 [Notothenia coriiceps]
MAPMAKSQWSLSHRTCWLIVLFQAAEDDWDLGLPFNNSMDLSTDSGTLPRHTTVRGPMLGQELSLSNSRCQTETGSTISLHLLEFKTHLLEAVEELHIRRDAETRFEDQISKLVLEKQELEWEKESLQHQIETVANQHTESFLNVKKKLQAKIRNTVEEKGKYQVSAEIKDKEINNLKDELKTLQVRTLPVFPSNVTPSFFPIRPIWPQE